MIDDKKIINENEMDGVKLTPSTIIGYTCQLCGNFCTKQYKNYKKSNICRSCAIKSKSKIKEDKEIYVDANNIVHLKNYSAFQRVRFVCLECGRTEIVENRSFDGSFKCRKCKHKNTYANFSEEKKKEMDTKKRQTSLARYGNETFVNTEKTKQTCLKKYGVECVFQNEEVIQKKISTSLKKYGVKNYVNQEKTRKTMYERYGGYTWGSEILRPKVDKTLREKYGKNLEEIVKKAKETKQDKYGDENYNNNELNKQTCLNKYGVTSYSQTQEYRKNSKKKYVYDDIMFDSSWELCLWIYATENGIKIEKEPTSFKYTYKGIEHLYFPDFSYDGKLIEVKGGHFLYNETLINPYDNSMNGLYNAKYNCMKDNNVELLTDVSFAINYVNEKYTKDYIKLFSTKIPFPYLNSDLTDKSDMGLIHHFHKSIYNAYLNNFKSPYEAWCDKKIIKKIALNRLKYVGKCRPSDILQGMNVTKIAPKVSVFSPKLATSIINKHVESKIIFDPFSGFSGRMIGAFNNKKEYIGQDINKEHITESQKLADYIGFSCQLQVQDILLDNSKELVNTCLFTCPPYGDKEKWNENDSDYSCDEWIDVCLKKYKCDEYLFVVDRTNKYNKFIIDEIVNKSHFNENKEYIIKMNKNEL